MTRQQYELNCEILQSLDKIDNCVMESETLVMNSMLNAYSKAVTVLEHCSDTADISSFNIIQESFILEDGEGELTDAKGNNKEKLIIKILMFIPRLIMKAVNFIKSKLSGRNTTKKLLQRIDELEKMSKADKEKIIQLLMAMKSDDRLARDNMYDDLKNQIDDIRQTTNKSLNRAYDSIGDIRAKSIKGRAELSTYIAELNAKLDNTRDVLESRIANNERRTDKIKDIINVMNGNIKTILDFDRIENMYSEILSSFKIIEKFDMHKPSTMAHDVRKKISNDKLIGTVENRPGGSAINNIDIFIKGKPNIMKLSTFKEKLQKVAEIRFDITVLGRKITKNLQSQVKEYERHIIDKKGKLNERQQTKVEDVNQISTYVNHYTNLVIALEHAFDKELLFIVNDFEVIKSLYIDAVK